MLFAIAIMGCESAEELVQESKSKENSTQTYIINDDLYMKPKFLMVQNLKIQYLYTIFLKKELVIT